MFVFGFGPDELPIPGAIPKMYKACVGIEAKPSRELKSDEFEDVEKHLKGLGLEYKNHNNIRYTCSADPVLDMLPSDDEEQSPIMQAERQKSDLIPGVYEGGCTIWECTFDVLQFLERENMKFDNKKILDLGCGAGLIGISCLTRGATCYFQDYNDEVLKYLTYPNVTANLDIIPKSSGFKFFCGDWSHFLDLWQKEYSHEEKFDYIFTSETIYQQRNYLKLIQVCENLLKPDGVLYPFHKIRFEIVAVLVTAPLYLAAKAYYFGCGGGLLDFRNFLDIKGNLSYRTIWKFVDGLVREIVEIKLR